MKLPFEQIQREILTRRESTTNPNYGKSPDQRTIKELLDCSVICLNKVEGPSSHQVSDYAKKALEIEKIGHGGTLDPAVTGVLPIALGKGTRVMDTLLKAGKEYICMMHLHAPAQQSKIHKTGKELVGKITQMPPVKSAVKRQLRDRTIYYLEILEIKDQDVLFKVGCEAGTYIRTLCVDWGKILGTNAHMQQLVRSKSGPFQDKEMYSLQDIKDAYELYKEGDEKQLREILKPIEFSVEHLAKVWLVDTAVDPVCHGANLSIPGVSKLNSKIQKNEMVAMFSLKNELVAIGFAQMSSEEMMEKQKGFAVKNYKVLMDPETYPHFKKA